jgi:electron transport complex protein RnfA
MENLLSIFLFNLLINNIVLTRFIGLCSYFGISRNLRNSAMMGLAVTFVATSSSLVTWFVNHYLLTPFGIQYMRIVAFILVIASFVQLVEIIMRKTMPKFYAAFGIYLPLITVNCAILAVNLINFDENYSLAASLVNGLATALGYTIAIVLLAGIRERLSYEDLPRSFRDVPIAFIVAGLLALAFQGFAGIGG